MGGNETKLSYAVKSFGSSADQTHRTRTRNAHQTHTCVGLLWVLSLSGLCLLSVYYLFSYDLNCNCCNKKKRLFIFT